MSESKKKVVRNKVAKILYPTYAFLFASLAIVCLVLYRREKIDFEYHFFQTTGLFFLYVGVIYFFLLFTFSVGNGLAAWLCKREHDYLRVSASFLLLILLVVNIITVLLAGYFGNVKLNYGENAHEQVNVYQIVDQNLYQKFAYSDNEENIGSCTLEQNSFATTVSYLQYLETPEPRFTGDAVGQVSFEYRSAFKPNTYDKIIKPSNDYFTGTKVEQHDDYTLYTSSAKDDKDDTYNYNCILFIETDHSYYCAEYYIINIKEARKDAFVQKALANYKLLVEQEKEVTQ